MLIEERTKRQFHSDDFDNDLMSTFVPKALGWLILFIQAQHKDEEQFNAKIQEGEIFKLQRNSR